MRALLPILLALSCLGGVAVLQLGDGAAPRIRVGPWSIGLDLGVSSRARPAPEPARPRGPALPLVAEEPFANQRIVPAPAQPVQGDGLAEVWVLHTEDDLARGLRGYLRRILTPLDASGALPRISGGARDTEAEMLERILELEADLDRVRLAVLGREVTMS